MEEEDVTEQSVIILTGEDSCNGEEKMNKVWFWMGGDCMNEQWVFKKEIAQERS